MFHIISLLKAFKHRQFRQTCVLTTGILLAWVLQIQAASQIAVKIDIYGVRVPRPQVVVYHHLPIRKEPTGFCVTKAHIDDSYQGMKNEICCSAESYLLRFVLEVQGASQCCPTVSWSH